MQNTIKEREISGQNIKQRARCVLRMTLVNRIDGVWTFFNEIKIVMPIHAE